GGQGGGQGRAPQAAPADAGAPAPQAPAGQREGQAGQREAQGGQREAPAGQREAPAGQGAAVDTIQGRRGRGFGGGAPAALEMHLSEYKVVNSIKLPHLITRGTNGETAEEWVIKSYRINPTFKGNT